MAPQSKYTSKGACKAFVFNVPPPVSLFVCMYFCIYVSLYLCIYAFMYLCIYVLMHLCTYAFMYLHTYVCEYDVYLCVCFCCIYVCVIIVKPAIPDLQTTLAINHGQPTVLRLQKSSSPVSLSATASRDRPRGASQELYYPLSAVHTCTPSSKRHLSQNVSFGQNNQLQQHAD